MLGLILQVPHAVDSDEALRCPTWWHASSALSAITDKRRLLETIAPVVSTFGVRNLIFPVLRSRTPTSVKLSACTTSLALTLLNCTS